jgi:hypothetical protein
VKKLGDLQAQHNALRIHINVADKIGQQTSKEAFHKKLEVEQGLPTLLFFLVILSIMQCC